LELNLEVLEQELQLPFSFVSGSIRELSIHVPWTKITSEPIKITINTIGITSCPNLTSEHDFCCVAYRMHIKFKRKRYQKTYQEERKRKGARSKVCVAH